MFTSNCQNLYQEWTYYCLPYFGMDEIFYTDRLCQVLAVIWPKKVLKGDCHGHKTLFLVRHVMLCECDAMINILLSFKQQRVMSSVVVRVVKVHKNWAFWKSIVSSNVVGGWRATNEIYGWLMGVPLVLSSV